MNAVGQPERATQNRVVVLFRDKLNYQYLGNWTEREGNSNIEEELFSAYLIRNGYTAAQISAALHKPRNEADNHSRSLYGNNQAVYSRLRYGVPVKTEATNWNMPVTAAMKKAVPPLIGKWESRLGVKVERFFVQRMKTRWGSCNSITRSIRLNTDLARKPPHCLEYIVIHEMTHLLEPTHNAHGTS